MNNLPIKQDSSKSFTASLIIAALVALASVLGLIIPDQLYPSEDLTQSFLTNDVVNLIVGLPVLVGSLYLVNRGKLIGLLLWPGALFFMVYNYLIYLIAMPINIFYILFPLIVFPSLYITIWILRNIDADLIASKLKGKVPERLSAVIMIGFGAIFIIRVAAIAFDIVNKQLTITSTDLGLHIADVFFSVTMIICGIQLWRKLSLGYITGLGLLFQTSMLFIGLILLMLLQPFITGEKIAWLDIIIVLVMGFISFIPFGLFTHAANRSD
jgi:hypothetical protein